MGFWGTIVIARSDGPIVELEGLRGLADSVDVHVRGEGGWQAVWLHRAPAGWDPPMTGDDREQLLTALLTQTGHPVLAGVVLDSDGAQVIGYGPRSGRWAGWLCLEGILDHLGPEWQGDLAHDDEADLPDDLDEYWRTRYQEACRPLYELVPDAAGAAPRAVAWAREAGFSPDAAEVEAALDGSMTFAEQHVMALARTLGVPLTLDEQPDDVEQALRDAVAAGTGHARRELAAWLGQQPGREADAERAWRDADAAGYRPYALRALAFWLAEQPGQQARAEQIWREAAAAGDEMAQMMLDGWPDGVDRT